MGFWAREIEKKRKNTDGLHLITSSIKTLFQGKIGCCQQTCTYCFLDNPKVWFLAAFCMVGYIVFFLGWPRETTRRSTNLQSDVILNFLICSFYFSMPHYRLISNNYIKYHKKDTNKQLYSYLQKKSRKFVTVILY